MAFYYFWKNPVMAGSTAEYAQVTKVSPEFFRVFAVEPVAGRYFNAEESKPGSDGVLMISYAYWQMPAPIQLRCCSGKRRFEIAKSPFAPR